MSKNPSQEAYRPTLLDLPISFFEYDQQRNTFANIPSQVTTPRRIVATRFYQSPVEAIRTESDKARQTELKKQLPATTPVALLYHRKRDTTFEEKIIQQWPMLTGDIDQQDNPYTDMADLKRFLKRLPYLLLCAHSVRGGLWFIVRIPDQQTPETLAGHFRYLQKLFQDKFEIKLDSSKGANPTALRYVSFDPDPYLNDNPTVMLGTYTPPKLQPTPPYTSNRVSRTEMQSALRRCVQIIEDAPDGQKHAQLNRAAYTAGGYIAGGVIDEHDAITALEDAIRRKANVTDLRAADTTIRNGVRDGKQQPIFEDQPESISSTLSVPFLRRVTDGTQEAVPYTGHVVPAIAESSTLPDTIFTPDESQIERLTVESCDTYPKEWDEPAADDKPKIRQQTFFEWQRNHPAFSRLGLPSLQLHSER